MVQEGSRGGMGFNTRLTDEMVRRYRRSGHWGDETFSAILTRRAAAHPEREALVDRRRRVTYAELAARVDRVAAKLGALGIGLGDVVTIQLPNWVEFAYVFFALERLGAVANQIGPDFRSREVEYIIRFSESCAPGCPTSSSSASSGTGGRAPSRWTTSSTARTWWRIGRRRSAPTT